MHNTYLAEVRKPYTADMRASLGSGRKTMLPSELRECVKEREGKEEIIFPKRLSFDWRVSDHCVGCFGPEASHSRALCPTTYEG